MKDFKPKGFIKVGEINGTPIHKKIDSGRIQAPKMERPELNRKLRVNPNLLNLETPGAGPMERPSLIDTGNLKRSLKPWSKESDNLLVQMIGRARRTYRKSSELIPMGEGGRCK